MRKSLPVSRQAKNMQLQLEGRAFPNETRQRLNEMELAINKEYAKMQRLVVSETDDAQLLADASAESQRIVDSFQDMYEMAKGAYDAMLRSKRKAQQADPDAEDDDSEDES